MRDPNPQPYTRNRRTDGCHARGDRTCRTKSRKVLYTWFQTLSGYTCTKRTLRLGAEQQQKQRELKTAAILLGSASCLTDRQTVSRQFVQRNICSVVTVAYILPRRSDRAELEQSVGSVQSVAMRPRPTMARPRWPSLVATLVMMATALSATEDVMTNQWHVHLVDDLGKDAAINVAKRNGFSFVSPVSPSTVFTARRHASAVHALSVCLSVRLPVTS